jgi:hypothetical protein
MPKADYLLRGMEEFLKTDLISYYMIQEDGEKIYICFGKRAFFLVDFNPPNPNDPPMKERVSDKFPIYM